MAVGMDAAQPEDLDGGAEQAAQDRRDDQRREEADIAG